MATFGYSVRGRRDLQIIDNFARSHGLAITALYQDPLSWRIPWREREQGSRLAALLQREDHVVVGECVFAGAADFLQTVADLAPLSITLHIAKLNWPSCQPSLSIGIMELSYVEKVAAAHADATFQWQSENVSMGMARAAQAGKRRAFHAGYGRRWRGDKRIIDEEECQIAGWIQVWREQGFSWYQMARALLRRKIKTKDGREWSAARVRRVYLASLKWRPVNG